MKLAPLGDKVVVRQIEAEDTTQGGLILTSAAKEKPQEGVVEAVGPGGYVGETKVVMTLKEGDKVFFSKYGATEIKFEGETYLVMRESDILAKIVE